MRPSSGPNFPERHRHTLIIVIDDLISRGIIAPGGAPYSLIR